MTDIFTEQTRTSWHEPMRPARDLPGEQVFYREWKRLMDKDVGAYDDETMIERVLATLPVTANERHSRVLASVVTWLGTNCGNAFLHEAKRLGASATRVQYPYLAQWAMENARFSWLSGGRRTLEHCLATEFQLSYSGLAAMETVRPKDLSAYDYEVVEHLMIWLGGRDGQSFLTRCEREVEAERQKLNDENRRKHSDASQEQNGPALRG